MIDMVVFANLNATIIALPFLCFVLALLVINGMRALRPLFACATTVLFGARQGSGMVDIINFPFALSLPGSFRMRLLPRPRTLFYLSGVLFVIAFPRLWMLALIGSTTLQPSLAKIWIGLVALSKSLISTLVDGVTSFGIPFTSFLSNRFYIRVIVRLFALAYALLVLGAILPIVLGFLSWVAIAQLYANLAVPAQSIFCLLAKGKMFICGGLVLFADSALFQRGRFWGRIMHSNGLLTAVAHATGRLQRRGGNSFVGLYYTTKEVVFVRL